MADAKKCDRCGKLFEPYNVDAGCKIPSRYTNILLKNLSLVEGTYEEFDEYDLCKECNNSLLKWLSEPKVAKHKCLNFGNLDILNCKCKSCPRYQECEEATKENRQKGCDRFGAFDGSADCLICPKGDKCRVVTEITSIWCFGDGYEDLSNQCRNCICKKECKISFDRKRFKGAKNK